MVRTKIAAVRQVPAPEPRPCTCHRAGPLAFALSPVQLRSASLHGGGWWRGWGAVLAVSTPVACVFTTSPKRWERVGDPQVFWGLDGGQERSRGLIVYEVTPEDATGWSSSEGLTPALAQAELIAHFPIRIALCTPTRRARLTSHARDGEVAV